MAAIKDYAHEQVLQHGPLSTLRGGIWQRGLGILTPERFYRITQGYGIVSMIVGGLLASFINRAFPKRIDIDIPLVTIAVIGRGKLGLLKDVTYIETIDGKSYQLYPGYEKWFSALKEALETHNHATANQSGDERWTIQH